MMQTLSHIAIEMRTGIMAKLSSEVLPVYGHKQRMHEIGELIARSHGRPDVGGSSIFTWNHRITRLDPGQRKNILLTCLAPG